MKHDWEMTAFPLSEKKLFSPLTLSHSKKHGGGCSKMAGLAGWNCCPRQHRTVAAFAEVSFLRWLDLFESFPVFRAWYLPRLLLFLVFCLEILSFSAVSHLISQQIFKISYNTYIHLISQSRHPSTHITPCHLTLYVNHVTCRSEKRSEKSAISWDRFFSRSKCHPMQAQTLFLRSVCFH